MNKIAWKNSIVTFLVMYLIYRIARVCMDIFFHHYYEWTGTDLSHLGVPIVLTVMITGIAAWASISLYRTISMKAAVRQD